MSSGGYKIMKFTSCFSICTPPCCLLNVVHKLFQGLTRELHTSNELFIQLILFYSILKNFVCRPYRWVILTRAYECIVLKMIFCFFNRGLVYQLAINTLFFLHKI